MDYQSALSCLRGLERLGYRFRLENTRELLEAVGFGYGGEVVHVGGTNGKGSCAAALNAVLAEAGHKVGLYTSPELIDFTERIRVGGAQIPFSVFARYAEEFKPHIDSMEEKPTFFEATTALALKYFEDTGVDVMVLEVGMGGRLDSTNAVDSRLAVVTNVDLDHTGYLGSTVREIAVEKAGIVHEGSALVTAASGEALEVLEGECRSRNASIIRVGADVKVRGVSTSLDGTDFTLDTGKRRYSMHSRMRGSFQAYNMGCAAAAAERLGVSREHITSGVSKAYWPGRLDVVQSKPLVILDSAHNPAGLASSFGFVRGLEYDRLIIVAGFSRDKDYRTMLKTLSTADVFIATRYKSGRSLETGEILRHVRGEAVEDAVEAVEHALKAAGSGDLVFVVGSIFLVGEAIRRWRGRIDLD